MRRNSVDVLRFFAVVLVLFRHFSVENSNGGLFGVNILNYLQTIGWIGVDLFFVLSGFLVSGLILNEIENNGSFNPIKFLVRRGFKIYPSFYLFIGFTSIYFGFKGSLDWHLLIAEIFYIQNYLPGIWNHTWSLAVEEHFYLLLAIVFTLALRVRLSVMSNNFLLVLILFMVLISIFKQFSNVERGVQYQTHLRIDSLFFGVLIQTLHKYYQRAFFYWSRSSLVTFVVLTPLMIWSTLVDFNDAYNLSFGFTLNYMYFCNLLVLFLSNEDLFTKKIFVLLSKLGFYSYSVYLWHMCCKFWIANPIANFFKFPPLVNLTIYLISSFIVGIALSITVEIPFLRLRDRLFPKLHGQ